MQILQNQFDKFSLIKIKYKYQSIKKLYKIKCSEIIILNQMYKMVHSLFCVQLLHRYFVNRLNDFVSGWYGSLLSIGVYSLHTRQILDIFLSSLPLYQSFPRLIALCISRLNCLLCTIVFFLSCVSDLLSNQTVWLLIEMISLGYKWYMNHIFIRHHLPWWRYARC